MQLNRFCLSPKRDRDTIEEKKLPRRNAVGSNSYNFSYISIVVSAVAGECVSVRRGIVVVCTGINRSSKEKVN